MSLRLMSVPGSCLSRSLGFAIVLAGLSGCVAADKPTLSADARQSLKLTSVSVDFAPNSVVNISPVEDQVHARGSYAREDVAEAEKAQIRRVLPEEFTAIVGPRLAGSRPVTAHITVTHFDVPGPLQTAVIGSQPLMAAGVDLVDAKSGETLVSIPPGKIAKSIFRPGGVIGLAVQATEAGDPSDKKTREMSRAFAAEYANWIVAN
jgi:hypothetical protein